MVSLASNQLRHERTMAAISSKRLAKELKELKDSKCPVGIVLVEGEDLKTWKLSIEVLGESVFKVCMVLECVFDMKRFEKPFSLLG